MVVLAAAVCDENGAVITSRQFVSMTRLRIEGLLSAFPKLLNPGGDSSGKTKQHTFVETDEVRYVYQPMDSLFVLLVTNKSSNILKDLSTLRLLAKLIPDYCQGHDEEAVSENAFDLIFAFDEVVSLGYNEDVDIQQIRTFTTMDSHEEKLDRIIQESKESEAIELAKRKAREIEEQKKNQSHGAPSFASGFGPSQDNYSSSMPTQSQPNKFMGFSSNTTEKDDEPGYSAYDQRPASRSGKPRTKGMTLSGNKQKKKNVFSDLIEEEKKTLGPSAASLFSPASPSNEQDYEASGEPVRIKLEERCTIRCERDGSLKQFEIQGQLTIRISDPDYSRLMLKVGGGLGSLKTSLPPKMDKNKWKKERTICFKNPKQPFAVGSDKQTLLKWKLRSNDEDYLPIQLNFWPEERNGKSVIACDYSVDQLPDGMILNDVCITFPGCESSPDISSIEGESEYDRSEGELLWRVGQLSQDDSGSIEFTVPEVDPDTFYPISIRFNSEMLYSGFSVDAVMTVESEDVECNCMSELLTQKFELS